MGLIRMYEISTRNKNNKKKASKNFRPESLLSEKKKSPNGLKSKMEIIMEITKKEKI